MRTMYETVWTFHTARFVVTLDVAGEDMTPEDGMCFEDDIAFAREGGWHWFQARVRVGLAHDPDQPRYYGDDEIDVELGSDYLGGCSYHSLQDFIAPVEGGYFRDMVRCAIDEARKTLARMPDVRAD